VQSVELAGSRAGGSATPLSDWDFLVETDDLDMLSAALPKLVGPLEPLVEQWDPLADHATYMLILRGPLRVDLIFPGERAERRPPWELRPETLAAIDSHFWDWILWLAAKRARGLDELVRDELAKMHGFLLGPLGVDAPPATMDEALDLYLIASKHAEERLGIGVSRALREEVLPAVRSTSG
jgi:hypothetical protein